MFFTYTSKQQDKYIHTSYTIFMRNIPYMSSNRFKQKERKKNACKGHPIGHSFPCGQSYVYNMYVILVYYDG